MQRTVEYRGFEIHIDLQYKSQDMFDVWFRIEGPIRRPVFPPMGLPRCVNRRPRRC